jgi:hypothetical protein
MAQNAVKRISMKKVPARLGFALVLFALIAGGVHADPGLRDALFPQVAELKALADDVLPSPKNEDSWIVKNPAGKVEEHSKIRIKTSNGWTPMGFSGIAQLSSRMIDLKRKIETASVERTAEVDQILADHLKKLIAEETAEKARMEALTREFVRHDMSPGRNNQPDSDDYIEPLITPDTPVCDRGDDHCFPSECRLVPGLKGDVSSSGGGPECSEVISKSAAAPVAEGTKASRLWDSYRAKRDELERMKLSRLAEVVAEYFQIQKRLYENYLGNAHYHTKHEQAFQRTAYNHLNLKLDARFVSYMKLHDTYRLGFNLWYPKTAYDKDDFSTFELGLTAQDRAEIEESVLMVPSDEYSYRKLMQLLVARERIVNWWGVARSLDLHGVEAPAASCASQLVTLKSSNTLGREDDPATFGYAQGLWSEDNLDDFSFRFSRVLDHADKKAITPIFKNFVLESPLISYADIQPLLAKFFLEFPAWRASDVFKAGNGTLDRELNESLNQAADPQELEAYRKRLADYSAAAKNEWNNTYQSLNEWAQVTREIAEGLLKDMPSIFAAVNGPGDVNHVPINFAQRMSWAAYRYWFEEMVTVFSGAAINNGAVEICEVPKVDEKTPSASSCLTYAKTREIARAFVSSKIGAQGKAWRISFRNALLHGVFSPEVEKTVGSIKTRRRQEIQQQIKPALDSAYRAAAIAQKAQGLVLDKVAALKKSAIKNGYVQTKSPKEELEWVIPFASDQRLSAYSASSLRLFFFEKLKRLNLWNEVVDPTLQLFPPDYAKNMHFSDSFQEEQASIQSDPLVLKYIDILFFRIEEKFIASLSSHLRSLQRSNPSASDKDLDQKLVDQSFEIAIARALPEVYKEFTRELTGLVARPDPKATPSPNAHLSIPAQNLAALVKTSQTKEQRMASAVKESVALKNKAKNVPKPLRLAKDPKNVVADHSIQKNPRLGGFDKREGTFFAALAVMNLSSELRERIGGHPFVYNKHLKALALYAGPRVFQLVYAPPKSKQPLYVLEFIEHMEELERLSLKAYSLKTGQAKPALMNRLFMSAGDQRVLAEVTYKQAEDTHPLLQTQVPLERSRTDLRVNDPTILRALVNGTETFTPPQVVVRTLRTAANHLKGKIREVCEANPIPSDPLDPKFVSFFSPRFENNIRVLLRSTHPEFAKLDKLTVRKTKFAIENWFEDNQKLMGAMGAIFGLLIFLMLPKFAGGMRSFLSFGKWKYGFAETKSLWGILEGVGKLTAGSSLQKIKLLGFISRIGSGAFFGAAGVMFLVHAGMMGYVNFYAMPPQLKYQLGIANSTSELGTYGEVSHDRIREFSVMLSEAQSSATMDILTQLVFAPMALSPLKHAYHNIRGGSVSRALKKMEIPGVSTEAVKRLRQPSLKERVAARGGGVKGVVLGAADQATFKVGSVIKYGRTIGIARPESVEALAKDLNEVLLPSLGQAVGGKAGMVDVLNLRVLRLQREIDRTKKVILNTVKRQGQANFFGDVGFAQGALSARAAWRFPAWMREWTESYTGFKEFMTGFLRHEYRLLGGLQETPVYQLGIQYKKVLREFSNPTKQLGEAKVGGGPHEAYAIVEFEPAVYDARTKSAGFWEDLDLSVAGIQRKFPLRSKVWDGKSWVDTTIATEAELAALHVEGQQVRVFNRTTYDPDIGWGRWVETGRTSWHPGVEGSVLTPGNVYRGSGGYRGWTGDSWVELVTESDLKIFLSRYGSQIRPEFVVKNPSVTVKTDQGTFAVGGGSDWVNVTDDFARQAMAAAEKRHLDKPLTLVETRILMLHAHRVLLELELKKATGLLTTLKSPVALNGIEGSSAGVMKLVNGAIPEGYTFTLDDWMIMRESISSALKETAAFDLQYLAVRIRPKWASNTVSDIAGSVGFKYNPPWSQRGNLQEFKRRFDMIMDELSATKAWEKKPASGQGPEETFEFGADATGGP